MHTNGQATNGHASNSNSESGHPSNEPLRIRRLLLENIGAFPSYELRPGGHFTLIEGDNEEGKTTIDKAFSIFFEGGNNAKLIRNGSDTGKIIVELTNGISFEKILRRAGKADLKMTHPEFGAVKSAQTYLEKLITNYFAVNPAKLLDAPSKERVEYLLSKLPIPVPTEELKNILLPGSKIPEGHALTVLPQLRSELEQRRKTKRQQREDKHGEVSGLEKALPSGDAPDIDTELAQAREALRSAEAERGEAKNAVARGFENDIAAKKKELSEFLSNGELALERAIAQLREEWTKRASSERDRLGGEITDLQDRKATAESNAGTQFDAAIKRAEADIVRLETAKEQETRDRYTRELLEKARTTEAQLESEWKDLDTRIKSLDALHRSLTAELPVPDLTIGEDADIWVRGVTWEQVNLARKIDVLFQLAELSSGDLDFIFFDDLEHLSSRSFEIFKERALASPKQVIANRVSDTPLTVTQFEREAEEVMA